MALLQDIQKNCNLCVQPDQTLWLDELKKDKPPAMKLAFQILCFASLMGKAHNALLRAYLVLVFIQKDFSVNWLANNSAEYIAIQLNLLGTKPVFVKLLKDVAVSIRDDHNGKVLDNLDDLLSIPDIRSCTAHMTLQYAFNQLNLSLVTMGLVLVAFHLTHWFCPSFRVLLLTLM